MNIGYLRVSTTDQKDHGVGLDSQRAAIIDFAARQGVTIDAWYQDDASGGLPVDERPGLSAAIEAMGKGGTIFVYARDRLARSVDVMATIRTAIRRQRGRIWSTADGIDACSGKGGSVTMEDVSRRVAHGVADVISEYVKESGRVRIRAALSLKIAGGYQAGQVPYGWRRVPTEAKNRRGLPVYKLERNPAEWDTLQEILSRSAAGISNIRIAADLNALNIRTRSGSKWWPESIRSIVTAATRPERVGVR